MPDEGSAKRIVDASQFDLPAAERAALDLLKAIGADLDHEAVRDTPRRVAETFAELVTPAPFATTKFGNDGRYDELVVVRDIAFQSLCAHHLLPFHGVAHVAYLPGEKIVGLSKLARIVDACASDLQLQERMTTQIASALEEALQPRGVGVLIEAQHLCMMMRGVEKQNSSTVTSCMLGRFRSDPKTRQEFLSLVKP